MTKENFIKDVIMYSVKIASSDISVLILNGQRLYQLEEYQALHIAKVMKDVSDKVVPFIIDSIKPSTNFADTDELLVRSFMFYFDKCVEMVYNMRVDNEKGIEFKLEELFNGISGDQIPEYIQIKINKKIGSILTNYKMTFDYAQSLDCDDIDLEDKIRTILYSSIQIATQYALEIDLNDDSEFQRFMEN
jgi:hypothetical protein